MAIFIIGYDLHEGEDYQDLENAIQEYDDWWHCLDSTWLIETSDTAASIKNNLKKHIVQGDRLLVMRYDDKSVIFPNATWVGFSEECEQWLEGHLK